MQYTEMFLVVKMKILAGKKVRYFAQNKDCGYTLKSPRRGGSNEYPQSMSFFVCKNKKYRPYHCIPQFYSIKVWFSPGIIHFTDTCMFSSSGKHIRAIYTPLYPTFI